MRILILLLVALMFMCNKKNKKLEVSITIDKPKKVEQIEGTGIFDFSELEEEKKEIVSNNFTLDDVVYFDFNKSEMRPDMQLKLDNIIDILNGKEDVILNLKGGCCPLGDYNYNKMLGLKRAKSVESYISSRVSNKILLSSYGEDNLISNNQSDYHLNRRCEIGVE